MNKNDEGDVIADMAVKIMARVPQAMKDKPELLLRALMLAAADNAMLTAQEPVYFNLAYCAISVVTSHWEARQHGQVGHA